MKRKREKHTCGYCIGSHSDRSCFRNKLDIMTKFLEENNIDVPYFARKEKGRLSLEEKDGKHLYGLGDRVKSLSHIFVFDVFISDSHSDISYSKTHIPFLEEAPNISPKFVSILVIFH